MFKNSGFKLKVVAKIIMAMMMIGCIAGGLCLFTKAEPDILAGVLLIVGGFFLAWIVCLCLTCIGEAAEASEKQEQLDTAIRQRMNSMENKIDWILDEWKRTQKADKKTSAGTTLNDSFALLESKAKKKESSKKKNKG